MKKKNISRFLRRKITLFVIPHHDSRPVRFSMPVALLLAGGLVSAALFLGAFSALFRQSAYHLVSRQKRNLERENRYFSQELNRLTEMAEELGAMQAEIRNLNNQIPRTAGDARRGEGGFTFGPGLDARLSSREFQLKLDDLETLLSDLRRDFSAIQATPLLWPVEGRVTSSFGYRTNPFSRRREFHSGIDIATDTGTPIFAPADGVVVGVERNRLAGNLLVIEHGNGVSTRYAHCHRILARRGEKVTRGQKIALVGNTGLSTGPHLHYEVHARGRPVNPWRYMTLKPFDGALARQ